MPDGGHLNAASYTVCCAPVPARCPWQPKDLWDYIVTTQEDRLFGTVQYERPHSWRSQYYNRICLRDEAGNRRRFSRNTVAAFRVNTVVYESFWLCQSA